MTAALVKHNPFAEMEVSESNDSDRTFAAWVSVDEVDRQGDRLDIDGFSVHEYLTVLGGPIMLNHRPKPVGRFKSLEKRTHPGTGKPAWYGKGFIFKGDSEKGIEEYPAWSEAWNSIVQGARKGKPIGMSIGGDPDWDKHPPHRECVDGMCHRKVPKTFLEEITLVASPTSTPVNKYSLTEDVNTLAKATHGHGKREGVIADPSVVGLRGVLGGEPVKSPSTPGLPDDAKVPALSRPFHIGKSNPYSVEEHADHYAEMAVKGDNSAGQGRTYAGGIDPSGAQNGPQQFGSLNLAMPVPPNAGQNSTQDFRDGGTVPPGDFNMTKGAGSWDPHGYFEQPQPRGDFSPTDAQMASQSGLVVHGGRRYEGEPMPADIAEARDPRKTGDLSHLHSSNVNKAIAGTSVVPANDPNGYTGEVGSMGGLRVSQTNDFTKEDEHMENLLRKAGQLTKMESRDTAIASVSYDLQTLGLSPGMAKGIAADLAEGDARSLRKAMKAGLVKDHDTSAGFMWDPDEENSKRPRNAAATSGNYPSPMTNDPKFGPDTHVAVKSPHRPASDTVDSGGKPGPDDDAQTNTNFPVNNNAFKDKDSKGDKPPTEVKKADCGCSGDTSRFVLIKGCQCLGGLSKPGPEHIHTDKWDRLVGHLKERGGVDNPYAVATSQLGEDSFHKDMPGMSIGSGMPPDSSPHRDMTQKAMDDKKKPPATDPHRPPTYDPQGKVGLPPTGTPGAGEQMTAQDGGKTEGQRPPATNMAPDAQSPDKQMPQMATTAPGQDGQSGLQTHPALGASGQPEQPTSPLPHGLTPVMSQGQSSLFGMLDASEIDALQLLLGMAKDGAPSGSPLTTQTPGAFQPRLDQTEDEQEQKVNA